VQWHPTEDDLILHFYGEHPLEDERRVDEHLATCGVCQASWSELKRTLSLVDAADVPEPDPGFERVMWARVREALPAPSTRWSWWSWKVLVPAVGIAALVVAAVVARPMWKTRTPAPSGVTAAADTDTMRQRVLLTALGDHFEQSEMLLVELMNAPENGAGAMTFERETADDLLWSSRLYRATAQQNGDVRLAQVLEDIESVLVEVARSPEKVDRHDFDSLRARITNSSLLFKVRAVTNEISQRQHNVSTVSEGTL
jgi:hypothetical protein